MKRIAILGALWGDEGKGHITHAFSPNFDWVIRFNGGANAGHTIYRDGKKFVHNLLPSVDFRDSNVRSYLGAGMVIDLEKLLQEVVEAEKHYPGVAKTIYVDKDAFIVEQKHKNEDKATNGDLGSTNRGIGPAYKDKIARRGLRIGDILSLKEGVHDTKEYPTLISDLYNLVSLGVHFISALELQKDFETSDVLFEGAQGIMLDINHGTYPYVSSSDCTIAGIAASGFAFCMPEKVYGVSKVYLTRVGEGPFPTELHGEPAEDLRALGNEYGATTGRPRRVGWLDIPALKYAIAKSGINRLILTKFDILNGLSKVTVCDSYKNVPVCPADFTDTQPHYTEVDGWTDAQKSEQLSKFINFIEMRTGVPVDYISRGTAKEDILCIDDRC